MNRARLSTTRAKLFAEAIVDEHYVRTLWPTSIGTVLAGSVEQVVLYEHIIQSALVVNGQCRRTALLEILGFGIPTVAS